MFKLIFGLIWIAMTTPIFLYSFHSFNIQEIDPSFSMIMLATYALFELVGIIIFISGLKTILKDKKTSKNGTICYGIISDLKPTGSYINEKCELKAVVRFINPITNEEETKEEIVGFNENKYPIDSYVVCKYYNGDINIEDLASPNEIPDKIKNYL